MKQILLVDNDLHFIKARAESLEKAGYFVLKATSVDKAQQLLSESHIHLAVIDLRLSDDNDEKDVSGLMLAKKDEYKHIPKIILTRYATYQGVREALSGALEGVPPAVDFIAKQEGSEAFLVAVEKAFRQYVRINWDLFIQQSEGNSVDFLHLVGLMEKDLNGQQVISRAAELGDLFRSLFYEMNQIRIERLLWQREGRAAVEIFAFAEEKPPEAFIVTCGRQPLVAAERSHYQKSVPKTAGLVGTVLDRSSETTHYAGNAYILVGASFESLHTILDLYRAGPEKSFHAALDNLFEKTLLPWQAKAPVADETLRLGQVYCERVGLIEHLINYVDFEQRIHSLIHQTPLLDSRLRFESGRLKVEFGGLSFSYDDPVQTLAKLQDINYPFVSSQTPGVLTGDNILTDASGKTWLTDFAGAGSAPELWNYIALEAIIRFDWVEANKIQWLHEMEQALVEGDFSRIDTTGVEPALRKTIRAIQTIRRQVSQIIGKNPEPYYLGILCQAARRIADFNPSYRLMPNELARLAHLLMTIAIISKKLNANRPRLVDSLAPSQGIDIDRANYDVRIEGVKIQLRGQSYDLLCYLYDRRNKLCTRRELIENVFHETYRDRDNSQVSKLNTAIRRLREKIENDPDHPRYLLTEPGGGYRLASGVE
jgi:DNA-binding response OmpR family regulator